MNNAIIKGRNCIKCGIPIIYHHLYCEEHYPHKSAEIGRLNKELKIYKKAIRIFLKTTSKKQKRHLENIFKNCGLNIIN